MRVFSQINNCQQKKKKQTKQKGGLRFKAWLNLYITVVFRPSREVCVRREVLTGEERSAHEPQLAPDLSLEDRLFLESNAKKRLFCSLRPSAKQDTVLRQEAPMLLWIPACSSTSQRNKGCLAQPLTTPRQIDPRGLPKDKSKFLC